MSSSLLSPTIELNPTEFGVGGTTGTSVVATVSVLNRPEYHGKPKITGLTTITPKIICSRSPAGAIPFFIMVSASETTADAGNPYRDLHFEWDFGDPNGTETFIDHWNGQTVNANNCQVGGEAGYVYRNPGNYTITLTAKGKDENGDIISASTTTLMVMGSYYIYLANATGGTYTLTFNGQTTAPIAYNDSIATRLAALQALNNLDTTNCRNSALGNTEIFGNLLGTNCTFTLTSSLTGTSGTPQIRADKTSSSFASVSVSNMVVSDGWSIQYFDSNYDGSNGVANGTLSRPWTTSIKLLEHIGNSGGNIVSKRTAYVKRGSTFAIGYTEYSRSEQSMRWLTYGTGAKPILNMTGQFKIELSWNTRNGGIGGDIVMSGFDIRTSMSDIFCRPVTSNNDTPNVPYSRSTDLLLENCDFTHSGAQETPGVFCSALMAQGNRGINMHGLYIWNCNLSMGLSGSNPIFITIEQWAGVWGGSCVGGHHTAGASTLDHHFYPNTNRHFAIAYVNFGTGTKSFCINLNAVNTQGAATHHLVTNCNITGTQNGIDAANSNNDELLSGRFEDLVIQFNKVALDKPGTSGLGFNIVNCYNFTLRYNDLYNSTNAGLNIQDTSCDFSVYHNRFYKGVMYTYGNVTGYLHNNIFNNNHNNGPALVLFGNTPTTSQSWDVDGNIWRAVGATSPINNNISLVTWQGYGNDINGQFADPGWADPANGLFTANPTITISWPNYFTDLEFSSDDGQNWTPYTNNSNQSLGASITEWAEVLFRASLPERNGTFIVTATSNATSLDINGEEVFATITGSGFPDVPDETNPEPGGTTDIATTSIEFTANLLTDLV